jgi:hypothetical protein
MNFLKRIYQFQFYSDFEALTELGEKIKEMQDERQEVPDDLRDNYIGFLATGF